jgi:hypothetical protein
VRPSGWQRRYGHERKPATRSATTERLGKEVVDVYLRNFQTVQALGASYRFAHLFYWQPTIYGKPTLSDFEKIELARRQPQRKFFTMTYGILREQTSRARYDKSFHDLSDFFSRMENGVHIDWAHVSERGNAAVSRVMAEHISMHRPGRLR